MSYSNFVFQQKTKIIFGKGSTEKTGQLVKNSGASKVLLTTGGNSAKESGLLDKIIHQLNKEGIGFKIYGGCTPNPRNTWVDEGARIFLDEKCDFILAVGGGSVIDASKGISLLVSNYCSEGIWYFVSGKGKFQNPAKPLGVVLTVAATGSENNGSFVISNLETREKTICTDESSRPLFAVCDPENTYTLSKWHTACGISDIISHVLEQYLHNDDAVDVSDNMSIGILKAVIKWGPVAMKDPENYDARANLMWASTIAMNGILGAGHEQNWITHLMEHAVSAVFDVSHGAGLACLTPYYLAYLSGKDTAGKIDRLGEELFGVVNKDLPGNCTNIVKPAVAEFQRFFISLGMPSCLCELVNADITDELINILAEKALPWGAMTVGGYKEFTVEDAKEIFLKAGKGILY